MLFQGWAGETNSVTHRFLGALEAKQVTEVTGVQVAFRIGNANSLTHMGRVASGTAYPKKLLF